MKDLTCLTDRIIAHRGLYNNINIPENSVPAFLSAINKGYAIELDVRLTRDKRVIVFHDSTLNRMCNVDKKVSELTYKEVLKYNLLNTKYKIPLLKDVLKMINGNTFLLIELKSFKFNDKLEQEIVKLLDEYNGSFAIQSFNIYSIYWFKKHRKNYIRGLLSGNINKNNNLNKMLFKLLMFNYFLNPDFIAYDIDSLPNSFVSSIRKRKIVISWTIKSEITYQKALIYSDNFIGEKFNLYM